MSNKVFGAAAAMTLMVAAISPAASAKNPMVGGAAMYPTKDIVDNAASSKDHTTLIAAVRAAGLVETLKGIGPFTIFAPTNGAFSKLPAGTVETLLQPASKARLTSILTYHILPGRMTARDISRAIKAGNGQATLTTVQGESLAASLMGGSIMLTDGQGGTAHVTIDDIVQSNGVIHVIDGVLLP